MKKFLTSFWGTWAVLVFLVNAQAALYDRGGGFIYDSDQDITWLQDANYAKTSGLIDTGMMDWNSAMLWAANLEYGGYNDWRLPSVGENPVIGYNATGSEMGYLYYTPEPNGLGNLAGVDISNKGPFINLEYGTYWTNTEYDLDPQNAWTFFFGYGAQSPDRKYLTNNYYAWAVHDGDLALVPIPGAVWLLGSGLVGLLGLRKKFKKN
jgi:hypothetical protein